MTAEEKVAAIVAALGGRTVSFGLNGVNIVVSDIGAMPGAPQCLRYTATASTGAGKNKVQLPVDTDYVICNPPLQVPDGGYDEKGRKTYLRNDVAALKQIVYDQITGYARAHGWVG